ICWICGEPIQQSLRFNQLFRAPERICWNCKMNLEAVEGGCPNCGKRGSSGWCDNCLYWQKQGILVQNHSLYYYNAFAKTLIERVKYHGDLRLLHSFTPMIQKYYKRVFRKMGGQDFVVVPVPLSGRKYRQRGFNQALVVAQSFPFPIYNGIYKAHDFTQSQRTRKERLTARADFCLKQPVDLKGKKILIVDDIYTTGSTVHQIARLLKAFEPQSIYSFTLFRS